MMRRFTLNVMVILGLIFFISNSVKIHKTAWQLFVINDNIQYYQEQPRKTDEMTVDIIKEFEYREEKFYNSKDPVISWFSRLHVILKLLVLTTDLVFGFFAVKETFLFTANTIYRLIHRLIHRRHKKGYNRK